MTVNLAEADEALAEWGKGILATIENRLLLEASGQTEFVTEVARHITRAGGKRFRPMLVVLAAGIGRDLGREVDTESVIKAALVVELTHVASLYHDDVMDSAELRRSAPSANAVYDNSVAIMIGDFLFARASSVVAGLGTDYVAVQAETFARLVQGQIAELLGPRGAVPVEHHLSVIADKTGSLIASSARFGGMVAGLGESELDALTAFGEEIGVVFQLSDDLIDITSDTTGKSPGTDLREGVRTLATLTLAASQDPEDAELKELVSRPLKEDEIARVLPLLRSHRVITETRAEILRRAQVARSYLIDLPEGPAKRGLAALCDSIVTRTA